MGLSQPGGDSREAQGPSSGGGQRVELEGELAAAQSYLRQPRDHCSPTPQIREIYFSRDY